MSFAILFDLDGVLVDSHDVNLKSFELTFEDFGAKKVSGYNKGFSLKQVFEWVEKYNKGIKIPHNEATETIRNHQYRLFENEKVREGLIDFLEEIKSKKVPMIVCTNSSGERPGRVLDIFKIREYFQKIITSHDVKNHKPNPEMFLKGAEELKLKPEECIVFEDTKIGITAGKAAGMKVVGFHNEGQDIKELKDADIIINSFEDVDYEMLNELISGSSSK